MHNPSKRKQGTGTVGSGTPAVAAPASASSAPQAAPPATPATAPVATPTAPAPVPGTAALYATGPATQVAGGLYVYAQPWVGKRNNPWGGAAYAPTAVVAAHAAAGGRFGLGHTAATSPKQAGSQTGGRWPAMAAAAGVQGGATLAQLKLTGNNTGDVRWAVARAHLVLLPVPAAQP